MYERKFLDYEQQKKKTQEHGERHVYTESLHLLHQMSCSLTQDKVINHSGYNPLTNKNNPTTINKYNNLNRQAAKIQSPQFCIKGELRQTSGVGCSSVNVVNWLVLSSETKEK